MVPSLFGQTLYLVPAIIPQPTLLNLCGPGPHSHSMLNRIEYRDSGCSPEMGRQYIYIYIYIYIYVFKKKKMLKIVYIIK
jgi:hypothetical protein